MDVMEDRGYTSVGTPYKDSARSGDLLLHVSRIWTSGLLRLRTSETMNPFRHFGRTPWTVDQPITRPLSTQDSTT